MVLEAMPDKFDENPTQVFVLDDDAATAGGCDRGQVRRQAPISSYEERQDIEQQNWTKHG